MGLLNANDTLELLYSITGAYGPDLIEGVDEERINIKGYYPRLKKLNDKIIKLNDLLTKTSLDLIKLNAQLEIANANHEAAISGMEEVED
jgi:hypothetical protein